MTPATTPAQTGAPPLITKLARGGVELIDGIAEEWRALCDAGHPDEPFYRPEWIGAYVRAFVPDGEVVLVTARSAGRLVAVLPLIREFGTLGGVPARKLRSAGNTHTCRYELVHDAGTSGALMPALWSALLREPGWDVLELENVVATGALAKLAEHARSEGYPAHATPGLTPPFLELEDMAGHPERVLERVDAKFRANLRRRKRKVEGRGPLALVETRNAEGALERFYALERAGWKGAEHSAIACNDSVRSFYDQVAHAGERFGYLSLYTLESAGAPAAMFYGLNYRGRYYLLKTAFDERLREFSPGQLLTHEVLRDLVARNGREFDFLGGMMEWKQDWAPGVRQLNDVHIFRGVAGRGVHALRFLLRPAVARAVRRLQAA